MVMFLQIVGGVVVTIVLIVFLIYLWIKIKFGQQLKLTQADSEPLQLHLNEHYTAEWREKGDAGQFLSELRNCGFELGRAYTVVEMEDVYVQSLFKPPYIATLYKHPLVNSWVDLSFKAKDEEYEIDVTNAELGETINSRPESHKIYLTDARIPEMFARLQEEVGDRPGAFVNDANYREHFEESYRKDMIWRCRQGGMTFDEFVATAKSGSANYKEDTIREAFIETKVQELHRWHEAAIERVNEVDEKFMESVYEKGKDVFTLPQNGNVEAFIRYIADFGIIDEDQADAMVDSFAGQSDLQMVATRIFTGLSRDLRPRKLRDVDFPVSGAFYEYP